MSEKPIPTLSEEELRVVDSVIDVSWSVDQLVDACMHMPKADLRWVNIARTELHEGFASLIRAVTQPHEDDAPNKTRDG